jgi:peptide/nickel transport system substrate-binding protein
VNKYFQKIKNFIIFSFAQIKNLALKLLSKIKKPQQHWQNQLDKKLTLSLTKNRLPNLKQLKYLPHVLSQGERKIVKIFTAIILICLFALGIVAYFKNTKEAPAFGGEYTEGLIGSPRYLNPLLAQTNDADLDLASLIFSGLFKHNQNLETIPDIASSYEISSDNKVYTIYLRKNVKWHNGENFTADDVIFTVNMIRDPAFRSPLLPSLRGIKAEKIDDYVLKFTLLEPYAPFLENLTFGILPGHLWINIPPANANLAEYNIKPIGTGPFQFKSLTKDKFGNIRSYVLASNENFYDDKSYIKKLTFKFYPDFESAIDALKSKEIEGLSYLPKEFQGTIKNKDLKSYSFNLPQYTALFFNPKNNDALKDKLVRQALAYNIDRDKIINEVLKGDGQKIDSPILPGFIGFNPDIKKYNFDPAAAAGLMDQANWKLIDGKRKNKDKQLELTLTTVDQSENYNAVEIIKNNWEALGIKVNLQIIPTSQIQKEAIEPRNYQILLYSEIIGADPDPYPFWHSSQISNPGLNLAVIPDRNIDQLLEEARKTNDIEERKLKYIQFQNILAENIPAIFLYNPIYTYITSKDIKGINLTRIIVPDDRFAEIEKWYINTRRVWQ